MEYILKKEKNLNKTCNIIKEELFLLYNKPIPPYGKILNEYKEIGKFLVIENGKIEIKKQSKLIKITTNNVPTEIENIVNKIASK